MCLLKSSSGASAWGVSSAAAGSGCSRSLVKISGDGPCLAVFLAQVRGHLAHKLRVVVAVGAVVTAVIQKQQVHYGVTDRAWHVTDVVALNCTVTLPVAVAL